MNQLVINAATREKRAAVLRKQQVTDLMIDQPNQNRILGTIYKARVEKVLPGMQAAFVNIGRDKNAYLHRDDVLTFYRSTEESNEKNNRSISHYIQQGQEIIVQVIKEEIGDKGARVSGVVTVPGHHLVYMPDSGYVAVSKRLQTEQMRDLWRERGNKWTRDAEGLIIRTAAKDVTPEHLVEELETLRRKWQQAQETAKAKPVPSVIFDAPSFVEQVMKDYAADKIDEIVIDSLEDKQHIEQLLTMMDRSDLHVKMYRGSKNIFTEFNVDRQFDLATRRRIWLKSGAFLIFDQTEALTVIDVNSGKFTGKSDLKDTVMKVNMEAAAEIARQLRLRDIGGIILIDFIDLRSENQKEELVKTFEQLLKSDRTQTKVKGLTKLGLLEMTRKKIRESLGSSLTTECSVCKGTGAVLSNESLAFQIERALWEYRGQGDAAVIEMTKEVQYVLFGENDKHRIRLQEALGIQIFSKLVSGTCEHTTGVIYVGEEREAERLL